MPKAIVTYSYPVKGNEAVIGKDFLKIPERLKDVKLAIDTKSIALSGPYHLIQGGLGVVARNPGVSQKRSRRRNISGAFRLSSSTCRWRLSARASATCRNPATTSSSSASTKTTNGW
jgi:hypothetical protein